MMKRFAKTLTLALGLALPIGASAQTTVVDNTYALAGFNWNSNGSGFLVRYRPYVVDDQVVVCGAWARRGSRNGISRQAMREARIFVGDTAAMRDLTWFNTVSNSAWQSELIGSDVSCRATGVAAAGVDLRSVRIEFREGRYRR